MKINTALAILKIIAERVKTRFYYYKTEIRLLRTLYLFERKKHLLAYVF